MSSLAHTHAAFVWYRACQVSFLPSGVLVGSRPSSSSSSSRQPPTHRQGHGRQSVNGGDGARGGQRGGGACGGVTSGRRWKHHHQEALAVEWREQQQHSDHGGANSSEGQRQPAGGSCSRHPCHGVARQYASSSCRLGVRETSFAQRGCHALQLWGHGLPARSTDRRCVVVLQHAGQSAHCCHGSHCGWRRRWRWWRFLRGLFCLLLAPPSHRCTVIIGNQRQQGHTASTEPERGGADRGCGTARTGRK
jgi:hypothetical protein